MLWKFLGSSIVIDSAPFQPERPENFIPVSYPARSTSLFYLGPNSGLFWPVSFISASSSVFWPINKFRPMPNILSTFSFPIVNHNFFPIHHSFLTTKPRAEMNLRKDLIVALEVEIWDPLEYFSVLRWCWWCFRAVVDNDELKNKSTSQCRSMTKQV